MYPRHARGNKIRFPLFPALLRRTLISSRLVSSRFVSSRLVSSHLISSHLEAVRLLIFIWNVTSTAVTSRYLQRLRLAETIQSSTPLFSSFSPQPAPQLPVFYDERSRNAGGQCSRKADSGTAVWPGRCIDRLLRCTFLLSPPATSRCSRIPSSSHPRTLYPPP